VAVPADLLTIDNPTTGQPIPAAYMDHIRTWIEFLADPPACSVYNSTVQSIPDDSSTVLTANSENFDNDSMHTGSSGKIIINTAGRYLVIASVSFAANATGNRALDFCVNSTLIGGGIQIDNAGALNATGLCGARLIDFAQGDELEVHVIQRSGGSLNATLAELAVAWQTR
jgi:hypothetical protein